MVGACIHWNILKVHEALFYQWKQHTFPRILLSSSYFFFFFAFHSECVYFNVFKPHHDPCDVVSMIIRCNFVQISLHNFGIIRYAHIIFQVYTWRKKSLPKECNTFYLWWNRHVKGREEQGDFRLAGCVTQCTQRSWYHMVCYCQMMYCLTCDIKHWMQGTICQEYFSKVVIIPNVLSHPYLMCNFRRLKEL